MSPSEDSDTTTPKRAVKPKVFTPLPSTSRDTATFDLNEKMYSEIYGDAEEADSSFDFLNDGEPPKKRTAISPAPPEPRIDDVALDEHVIVDDAYDTCNSVVDVVSIDDVDIADQDDIVCCVKSDSDEPLILNQTDDIEIIDSTVTHRRSKRKRRSRTSMESPVVVLDSSDEESIPKNTARKSTSRLSAKRKSPIQSSPALSNDSVSTESGVDNTMGTFFDPLMSFIDTVDLSKETFKPTPIINDVIVIDSDSPARVPLRPPALIPSSLVPTPAVPETRVISSEPKLLDCPVCLDSFSSIKPTASTFCGHIFCKPCMVTVMRTSKRCPTCRKQLKGKGFHLLYL